MEVPHLKSQLHHMPLEPVLRHPLDPLKVAQNYWPIDSRVHFSANSSQFWFLSIGWSIYCLFCGHWSTFSEKRNNYLHLEICILSFNSLLGIHIGFWQLNVQFEN